MSMSTIRFSRTGAEVSDAVIRELECEDCHRVWHAPFSGYLLRCLPSICPECYERKYGETSIHSSHAIYGPAPKYEVKVVPDMLVAQQVGVVEGNTCVVVHCDDYDHYKRLPQVVSYNGILCGKTGWNSDTNRAHYQSNATIVKVER